jgi:hypothetical protein
MKFRNAGSTLGLLLAITSVAMAAEPAQFSARVDGDQIIVSREGIETPLVVQNAKLEMRPYLHPIQAPDGKGTLTQYSPGHHRHQTGLYWGFTRVNGRDYFHHPKDGYWRLKERKVITAKGPKVQWQTVYDMLGADKKPVLVETQTWTISGSGDSYALDLDWKGTAPVDVKFSRYAYGGLFLRMPWSGKTRGTAVNSGGLENRKAEGKRSRWVDIGMPIKGRDDWGHIVMMDHPKNDGHPIPWRVDGQLGVGPCRARLGEWKLAKGESSEVRHRLYIYTGKTDARRVHLQWKRFSE